MKVKQSLSYKIRDYLVVSIAYNLKIKGILTAGDLESHWESKKCMIQRVRYCVHVYIARV